MSYAYFDERTRALLGALADPIGVLTNLKELLESLDKERAAIVAAIDLLSPRLERKSEPVYAGAVYQDEDGDLWHEDTDGLLYLQIIRDYGPGELTIRNINDNSGENLSEVERWNGKLERVL